MRRNAVATRRFVSNGGMGGTLSQRSAADNPLPGVVPDGVRGPPPLPFSGDHPGNTTAIKTGSPDPNWQSGGMV